MYHLPGAAEEWGRQGGGIVSPGGLSLILVLTGEEKGQGTPGEGAGERSYMEKGAGLQNNGVRSREPGPVWLERGCVTGTPQVGGAWSPSCLPTRGAGTSPSRAAPSRTAATGHTGSQPARHLKCRCDGCAGGVNYTHTGFGRHGQTGKLSYCRFLKYWLHVEMINFDS